MNANPWGRTFRLHYPGASTMTSEELRDEKRWIIRNTDMGPQDVADVAMLNAWLRRREVTR